MVTDAGLHLVEAALESTESSNSNVLARCSSALDDGILAKNMAVASIEDLGSSVAALVRLPLNDDMSPP